MAYEYLDRARKLAAWLDETRFSTPYSWEMIDLRRESVTFRGAIPTMPEKEPVFLCATPYNPTSPDADLSDLGAAAVYNLAPWEFDESLREEFRAVGFCVWSRDPSAVAAWASRLLGFLIVPR